jgi:hypothetical protein
LEKNLFYVGVLKVTDEKSRIRIRIRSSDVRIRIKIGKLDPNPHQSEKVKALEGPFGALEGPDPDQIER